ncbi:MAG: ATP-binding cassette domain-containing protein [Candidatus Korarchaeum sp.]
MEAVDVRRLVKVYDGKVRALDGVDLHVSSGRSFALLGPNGAGKTTLMRILTTQIRPTSGNAYVLGLDVVRQGSEVRKLVSYVPQEMSVWTDISGYENLLIYSKILGVPSSERKELIDEVLEAMDLARVKHELVRNYSGGMIRRLEIACAMLVKPRIMFLDEPTIGLDPAARKVVWERLREFKREYGVTIFFNTHYMDEADSYADEIAIINAGKVVARGTSEELKRSMGNEVISLALSSNSISPEVLSSIRSLDFVDDLILDNGALNVFVKDAENSLPSLLNVIRDRGVDVTRVSVSKPTLDDVFLRYASTRFEGRGRLSDVGRVRYMIRRG